MTALPKVDEEAKELNKKTRPIAYCPHIGDVYYVSVTSGVMCVDIRMYYVPYGLTGEQARQSKSGLALRLDEWVDFMGRLKMRDMKTPDGQKMQDLKMRDMNLRHQFAQVEIAGHENAGPTCRNGKYRT